MLQYGRKDIESVCKHKNQEKFDDDEGYSEDIVGTETESKSITPPNGIKNGLVNGNGKTNVISRDDKLILNPEPLPHQKEEDNILSTELKEDNKV